MDIVHLIDSSPKPIIACVTGICYGGGLELALACHYRIATNDAQLALPEIQVGVIPGAGGTQRLPRLIGLPLALRTILTGQSISAGQAHAMHLIDALVVPGHNKDQPGGARTTTTTTTTTTTSTTTTTPQQLSLLEVGHQWAQFAELMPISSRRISQRAVDVSPAQAHVICHLAALSIPNITLSHQAIIEACRASVTARTFDEGMQTEAQLFRQVLRSVEGQARRHAFFAVRHAQKPVNDPARRGMTLPPPASLLLHAVLDRDPKTTTTTTGPIEVAVIGAGTMGSGIAIALLQVGYKVYLVDNAPAALQKGVTMVTQVFDTLVTKKKLSAKIKEAILSKQQFVPTTDLNDLQNCALIVEAIIENMSIKQKIFRQLNHILNQGRNDHCIVTSNTSTLDIATMASVMDPHRQGQFAGWHFFSPAHVMKLVEIIHVNNQSSSSTTTMNPSTRHISTSPQTIALLQSVTKRMGKIGVVVGNCDGFCGNRMLRPYSAETVLLLVEADPSRGRPPPTTEQVDHALRNVFGMALGPFEMSDLAGNDIGYNIRKERKWVRTSSDSGAAARPAQRPSRYTELADDMVSQLHRYGQKVGKGWYDYDRNIGKGRKPLPSIEMSNFIQKYIEQPPRRNTISNVTKECLSDQEIIERVLYPLVNEGFKCLEEGIVARPSDIDVVYIYGYGFPVTKGGPMYWADHIVTLPQLLSKLQEFQVRFPTTDHYQPSQLLIDCVRHDMTLADYWVISKDRKNERQSSL